MHLVHLARISSPFASLPTSCCATHLCPPLTSRPASHGILRCTPAAVRTLGVEALEGSLAAVRLVGRWCAEAWVARLVLGMLWRRIKVPTGGVTEADWSAAADAMCTLERLARMQPAVVRASLSSHVPLLQRLTATAPFAPPPAGARMAVGVRESRLAVRQVAEQLILFLLDPTNSAEAGAARKKGGGAQAKTGSESGPLMAGLMAGPMAWPTSPQCAVRLPSPPVR